MAAKICFIFFATMLACIVGFLVTCSYLPTLYRRVVLELRMYTEPASNEDILAVFADKINCSTSSPMLFRFQHLNIRIVCGKNKSFSCQKWYWDVANGTIIYSNESFQSEINQLNQSINIQSQPNQNGSGQSRLNQSGNICAYPVLGERVQKIIFANGSTQYPGCNWTKMQCAPYNPHYDKNLRLRINTGPCCRKIMFDQAQDVTSAFDEHNITVMVISGGVIGWARDQAFVPYDFDIDLLMDDRDRVNINDTVGKVLKKKGYVLKYVHQNTRIWPCRRADCIYSPGIWFYRLLDGGKRVSFDGRVHPFEDIFPLQRGILGGRKFWFPRNPVNYLNAVYGEGKWEKPYYCNVLAKNDYCIS